MRMLSSSCLLIILLVLVSAQVIQVKAYYNVLCDWRTRCPNFMLYCPAECPSSDPGQYPGGRPPKLCRIDCNKPGCDPWCISRRPDCTSPGSACYDPRFIGGDGRVFYFHGKSNQHFTLVSDPNLQINARFIGHRPAGRTRDFTWVQALGLLFDSHTFSLEATKSATWDDEIDHLKFSYDGKDVDIPTSHLANWNSPEGSIKIERTASKNSVIVTIPDVVEILVNVVPVTKEDDRIYSYKVPSDDCFAHLEVQFRFVGLSDKVEGVLGRTYQPNFENPAKPGVAMPVVGGEDKYSKCSLLSAECAKCVFSPTKEDHKVIAPYGKWIVQGKWDRLQEMKGAMSICDQ